MNIPNIPTDNLYKFMALTGVLLFIGGFLIVWFQADRSQQLFREYKQGAALIEAKMEIAELQALRDEKSNERIERSSERLREARLDRAKLVAIEEELKLILEEKPWFMAFFVFCGVAGSLISVAGFWLWYARVQKYQDMILRKAVSK